VVAANVTGQYVVTGPAGHQNAVQPSPPVGRVGAGMKISGARKVRHGRRAGSSSGRQPHSRESDRRTLVRSRGGRTVGSRRPVLPWAGGGRGIRRPDCADGVRGSLARAGTDHVGPAAPPARAMAAQGAPTVRRAMIIGCGRPAGRSAGLERPRLPGRRRGCPDPQRQVRAGRPGQARHRGAGAEGRDGLRARRGSAGGPWAGAGAALGRTNPRGSTPSAPPPVWPRRLSGRRAQVHASGPRGREISGLWAYCVLGGGDVLYAVAYPGRSSRNVHSRVVGPAADTRTRPIGYRPGRLPGIGSGWGRPLSGRPTAVTGKSHRRNSPRFPGMTAGGRLVISKR
jgi:hypothetical protein